MRPAWGLKRRTLPNGPIQALAGKTLAWLRGYDYHVEPEMAAIEFKWLEVDSPEQAFKNA